MTDITGCRSVSTRYACLIQTASGSALGSVICKRLYSASKIDFRVSNEVFFDSLSLSISTSNEGIVDAA